MSNRISRTSMTTPAALLKDARRGGGRARGGRPPDERGRDERAGTRRRIRENLDSCEPALIWNDFSPDQEIGKTGRKMDIGADGSDGPWVNRGRWFSRHSLPDPSRGARAQAC